MNIKKVILVFMLVFILVNIAPVKAESNILVVHSYHQGLKWTDEISRGIQSVFSSKESVNVYYEYLDTKRNYSSEYYEQLVDLYKKKNRETDFEAVITCDNAALNFVLEHRKELYPQLPIVFSGINNYKPEMIKGSENITGVIERASHKENIDLILQLHPQLDKLVIINDKTLTGKNIKSELNRILSSYQQQVETEVINEFTIDNLEKKVSQLNKEAVIYLLVINRDGNEEFISYSRGIKKIKQACDNPIYGAWDFYLDEGMIGGKLVSGFEQGRKAAQLVQRILNGEQADQIPIQKNTNKYIFDYNQLRKFNITLDQLPEDSKMINYSQSFYDKYKHLIWKVSSSIFVLLVIIFILGINILKRKKAEQKLQQVNQELDKKVKKRTKELKQEKDKLQKYFDIAEVAVWAVNKEGKIISINRKGCELLGYQKEEVLGKDFFTNFIKPEDRKELRNFFDSLINGEEIINDEIIEYGEKNLITRTGEERRVICRDALLTDEDGKVKGVLASNLDITEQEALREELEYNKLKVQFFANLAHELKTPLNLLFSSLQMLNQYRKNNLSSEVNEKLAKYTDIIKQNNYRLLRLVNNIVDITKIDSNSFDLKLQNCDIVELVQKITYSVEDYIANKDRSLKFNSDVNRRIIACDPFSIERIILNLLSNAVKFTEEGDQISVNISTGEESITIAVKDTGIGITEKKQEMIFKRFRQADKSFTRQNEGSGIGLTLVKLLVELHEGEITVDSQPGEFTKFTIKLPVRKLTKGDSIQENNKAKSLIDRIRIEFSDVYGL